MIQNIIFTLLCFFILQRAVQVNCQDDDIQDQLQKTLEDSLGSSINLTAISGSAGEVFKNKCIKQGSEETYKTAEEGTKTLRTCIENLIDFNTINKEIETAKPKGDLDTVFKKYCGKSPELKKCVSDFTKSIKGCLNEKEQENIDTVLNITESLTDFICFKEGDRIALFIAEGGPECLEEKTDDIQDCVNSTFYKHAPKDNNITVESIPEFVFDDKLCSDIRVVQDCIVDRLTSCKEPTPSNIAESLFKYIRQVTPCENTIDTKNKQSSQISSANSLATSWMSAFLGLSTLLSVMNVIN